MTNLERAALVLAAEIENCISLGVPTTTSLVTALDNFRKIQVAEDELFGKDLDNMYKQYLSTEPESRVLSNDSRISLITDKKESN